LRNNGFKTILLESLSRRIRERDSWALPERSVVISFDDGYLGNYSHAFPLLKEFGFHAVFFVTTNWIGHNGMMDWAMLEEMSSAGMSIQSHTKTHPFLKQLSDEQAAAELLDSKLMIEKRLQKTVRFISLPHGSHGENFKRLAEAAGYSGGCSSRIGYNNAATDEFFMRRIHVSSSFGLNEFRKIVYNKGFFVPLLALKQRLRNLARRLIGENIYMGLYRVIFGIKML
jgi:peptidoglycan/xylan/chitin deacetylase (PgdA/CDA1 family)